MSLLVVQNLGKSYKAYRSEWHRFASWFGMPIKPSEEHWVLRGISFDIHPGEAVGIIGQNGAGKSTLLKMITGTLPPTEGEIQINGRIAAILELGMGFNPELTGRQNVQHTAGLMGFSHDEIDLEMSSVEAFSEIGDYFDEPVRTYSSGMQVRVAFAVATAWRPEILIIDEALSVGDSYFQHKSFSRIREFQQAGTTLIIVSHDRSAIQALCERALFLANGTIIKDGAPDEVFDFYNAIIADKEDRTIDVKLLDNGKSQIISGTGEAQIEGILFFNSNNDITNTVLVGERIELRINVRVNRSIDQLVLGYGIKDRLGQVIFGTNTWHTKQVINKPNTGSEYRFRITFLANLGVGSYSICTALTAGESHIDGNYEWKELALVFNVVNEDKQDFIGSNWMDVTVKCECVEKDAVCF